MKAGHQEDEDGLLERAHREPQDEQEHREHGELHPAGHDDATGQRRSDQASTSRHHSSTPRLRVPAGVYLR